MITEVTLAQQTKPTTKCSTSNKQLSKPSMTQGRPL